MQVEKRSIEKIVDGLYIGDIRAAQNKDTLTQAVSFQKSFLALILSHFNQGITHIVQVADNI